MMTLAYDFGYRLRELRENRNLSQTQVATRLGLSRATISSYENNIITPSVENLAKLALLYRTSTDYLLGLENDKQDEHYIHIPTNGLTIKQKHFAEKVLTSILAEIKHM